MASKFTIEAYFQLLANSEGTNNIIVLPEVNAVAEVFLKECVNTHKQLMGFNVGPPENTRLVVCTQEQILRKFMADRRSSVIEASNSVPPAALQEEVLPDNESNENQDENEATENTDSTNGATEPAKPTTKSNKRPDLPRYVSPAAKNRSNGAAPKPKEAEVAEVEVDVETTEVQQPPPTAGLANLNVSNRPPNVLVQPPEDENWKRLNDTHLDEIYGMLGNVTIVKPELEDCPPEMRMPLKDNALDHIVELYNMHKDIKTKDLVALYGTGSGAHSNIRWVDDERAMAVFPSPLLAHEALQIPHPVIQSRLIENGSRESKLRIMSCVTSSHILPWKERPKTVTFMARRLISNQLGPEFKSAPRSTLIKENSIVQEALAQKLEKVGKRRNPSDEN